MRYYFNSIDVYGCNLVFTGMSYKGMMYIYVSLISWYLSNFSNSKLICINLEHIYIYMFCYLSMIFYNFSKITTRLETILMNL